MPDFPSPEWVATADAALARHPDLADQLGDAAVRIGYTIDRGEPFHYHLAVGDGTARMEVGLGGAPVVLHADEVTAAAIHDGEVSSQDAVITGALRIEGDATCLIAARPALDAVNRVLDGLRAATGDA